MLITKIIKLKNKAKIFFDNKDNLIIRYDVVVKNGLRKGDEIEEKFISSLIDQNENFTAKETAFRLLTRRHHSKKELERKLLARKFNKEIVNHILQELENNNYLDDEKFSREFTEEKLSKKHLGRNLIKARLKEKGVSSEIISMTLNERSDDEEFSNALFLAEKKLAVLKTREDENKIVHRIHSYLQLRGYSYDIIRKVLDQLLKPENYSE